MHTNYKILPISDLNRNRYDDFLNKNRNDLEYFHSYSYYRAVFKIKNTKPIALAVINAENIVVAALIGELANENKYLPYISRRLIIYSKPIYNDYDALKYLINYLIKLKTGLFIQIRSFSFFSSEEKNLYENIGFLFDNHLNAYINMKEKSEDEIFSSIKKDKRKGIRRAINRFNINIIDHEPNEESIDTFYSIQKKLFKRKRHALKSKDYFSNLVSESKGNVRIAFALFDDKVIAAQLYIIFNQKITAFYTATEPEHLDKYAGDLLIWYLLKKGINENCELFDFGGGGNPDKKYGAREYKERFGAKFENVGRLNFPKSPLYKIILTLYNKILKN